MACALSKSFGLSSSLKRSGIVTILSGECDSGISSNTSASSLRRTFSADMSSKYLLSRNGFCPMKTCSSSEEIHSFVTDSQCSSGEEVEGLGGGGGRGEEDSRSAVDIWAHIQEEKKNKMMDEERPGQSGVWSSILSQKSEPIKMVAPSYVHPIVKQFSSSLSKKSLEICTESLGSETGSDGFSLFPSPEAGDTEEEKVNKQDEPQKVVAEAKDEDQSEAEQETWVANSNTNTSSCKKSSRGGSFPPPIPSLSNQSGKSLLMKTRRDNGRLVLEAVSLPSQNNFCAKRQDGRLVLTFTDSKDNTDDANEKEREEESRNSEVLWFNEEDEEGEGEEDAESPNGFVSVHRLAHKAIGIPNRNLRWSDKDEPSGKSKVTALVAQSLPPRPRLAQLTRVALPPSTVDDTVGAACFNTYNYYWRPTTPPKIDTKPSIQNATAQDSLKKPTVSSGGRSNDGWLNGCKEQRRSLLFFEPYCIATS